MVEVSDALNVSDSARDLEIVFGKPEKPGDALMFGGGRGERQRRVKYWRKPEFEGATDSGWICVGPDYATDSSRHKIVLEKGWKELPNRFGIQLSGQPADREKGIKGTTMGWEGNDAQRKNPIVWLEPFIEAGGLTYIIQPNDGFGTPHTYLMPSEQIVSYGLHRRNGMKGIRPDISEAVDIECPHKCINNNKTRKLFSGINLEEAQKSLDQHMTATHRQSEGARAVGMEVSKQWEMAESRGAQLDVAAIAKIVAATLASLQESKMLDVAKPEPNKYPDGEPDDTWKRAELMSYAADRGIGTPPDKMKATRDIWLEYVKENDH